MSKNPNFSLNESHMAKEMENFKHKFISGQNDVESYQREGGSQSYNSAKFVPSRKT